MTKIVYLRMKKNIELTHLQSVKLKDIAFLAAPEQDKKDLEDTHIYRISKEDNNIVVIDSFLIIEHLNEWYEHLEFQLVRSEEHTSELQSRGHLVCRLLLEKKNK